MEIAEFMSAIMDNAHILYKSYSVAAGLSGLVLKVKLTKQHCSARLHALLRNTGLRRRRITVQSPQRSLRTLSRTGRLRDDRRAPLGLRRTGLCQVAGGAVGRVRVALGSAGRAV